MSLVVFIFACVIFIGGWVICGVLSFIKDSFTVMFGGILLIVLGLTLMILVHQGII